MNKRITRLIYSLFLLSSSVVAQNALSFDGIDDKVDLGNPAALQITGSNITIEAWIYPTSWRTNVFEGGIVVKEMNSSNNGYMFRAGNNGRLNFAFGASGLPWKELTSAANTLSLNTWQHVAATYNGSRVKLYVDGIAVDSANYSGNIGNATNNCVIGGWYSTGRNFPGKIDEVRIWNSARTGSQIANSMNGEFCSAPTGLVAYYKFNQGTAGGNNTGQTTLTDYAGNNNGTLQNFALTGASSNWTTGASLTPGAGGSGTVSITACDSYVSPGGNVYTTNGTYIDTITSPLGCDSILTINLTINSSSTGSITATGCNSYTSPSGNYTWTTNGTYFDTLVNAQGCDSVLTIGLTLNSIDTNVLQNGIVLTSWAAGVNYQWLDCANGFAPIAGANNQTFIPIQNGDYAVEVSDSNCVDTSACYAVTGIGLQEHLASSVKLYPNPGTGTFHLEVPVAFNAQSIQVVNASGQLVYAEPFSELLNIPLAPGYYFLIIKSINNQIIKPLIVHE
jgi:hypothetical protein